MIDENSLKLHLIGRSGFGASESIIECVDSLSYEDLVENLIGPKPSNHIPDDILFRDQVDLHSSRSGIPAYWAYRMLSTDNLFLEKIALFWHGIFATGNSKLNNLRSVLNQVDMFREYGLGRFDDLLLHLSQDPAMLVWLDNQDNHSGSINENYGREILELFSMGVGNYTETDIKECARAFTGWTLGNSEYMSLMSQKDSIWPYGRIVWHHRFDSNDHDYGEKQFLNEIGNFDGSDVVEIICQQKATAEFISRHLYNFFVADEVPVPQWNVTGPRDPDAIQVLVNAYFEFDHDIKSVIRVLFNSDFFKNAVKKKVKSPAELVIGTLRLSGQYSDENKISSSIFSDIAEAGFMGQSLTNPPSVEGWHTGEEWITSGSLVDRVNFASKHLTDMDNDGVKLIVDRVIEKANMGINDIYDLINICSREIGLYQVSDETKNAILDGVDNNQQENSFADMSEQKKQNLILDVVKLASSSKEYQLC